MRVERGNNKTITACCSSIAPHISSTTPMTETPTDTKKRDSMESKRRKENDRLLIRDKWDRDYLIKVTQSNTNAGRIKINRGAAPYNLMSTRDYSRSNNSLLGRPLFLEL